MKAQDWNVGEKFATGEHVYWHKGTMPPEDVYVIETCNWEARDFLTVAYIGACGVDQRLAVESVKTLLHHLSERGFSEVAMLNMAIAVADDTFKKVTELEAV